MPESRLGATLVIANPAAHSGKGGAGAEAVRQLFEVYDAATSRYELVYTAAAGDAERLAADAEGFDTVLAVGGDGVIHEVVNGLMALDQERRPRLGIVPLGSGNDFARTLGMTPNDPSAALHELLQAREHSLDVGHVVSDACPKGTYFMETLSFGLDAAIAIDTTDRRAAGTRQEGAGLFVTSSLKLFARAGKGYPCVARLDGGAPCELQELIFAVQNGPTYGGGFRICPSARPDDGLLDVCCNVRRPWLPHLLVLLGLARFGRHTGSRAVRMEQARHIDLSFAGEVPPCQVDGEAFEGTTYAIDVEPAALRVLIP